MLSKSRLLPSERAYITSTESINIWIDLIPLSYPVPVKSKNKNNPSSIQDKKHKPSSNFGSGFSFHLLYNQDSGVNPWRGQVRLHGKGSHTNSPTSRDGMGGWNFGDHLNTGPGCFFFFKPPTFCETHILADFLGIVFRELQVEDTKNSLNWKTYLTSWSVTDHEIHCRGTKNIFPPKVRMSALRWICVFNIWSCDASQNF